MGPARPLRLPSDRPTGVPPSRERQYTGRRTVQGVSRQWGMGALPNVVRPHIPPVRQAVRRHVRDGQERQTPDVLLQIPRPAGLEDRRPSRLMGGPLHVRLSPTGITPQNSHDASGRGSGHAFDRTLLAQSSMVPTHHRNAGGPTIQIPTGRQAPLPTERPHNPPRHHEPPSSCVETLRLSLQTAGFPPEVADIAVDARRQSTVKTYDSRLHRYYVWAGDNAADPVEASVDQVAAFLLELFREGKQISTIRNYRSAIAAVHSGFSDGSSVGTNPVLRQVLRGMFHRRPPRRRLAPSWALHEVLTTLAGSPYEPLHNAPLDKLTHKTLFLIAAASARRRSCLHALTLQRGFTRFEPGGVRLLPDPHFLPKNQSVTFTPNEIFLPSLSQASSIAEDKRWCPVRALKWYIERTKQLRTSDRLFILPRSPYTPASKDTISRWMADLIRAHTQPGEPVRAHDVRGHATSRAWFRGVPLEDIMKAAAWKTPSSFVACYLTNTPATEGDFARAALGPPPARSSTHRQGSCVTNA
ncbi:hypothetical protein BSL78_27421 [Apostichopus japonicus]|nr:hypothetical protein BSL78_29717 [Apostichopus japonicus]PIK35753.1 hypothetical protein BSL78_27421 [Apostichopus japonicus]